MKKKPQLDETLFILDLNDNTVFTGKVIEVTDTPRGGEVTFRFTLAAFKAGNQEMNVAGNMFLREKFKLYSSSFHLNPKPYDNMKWGEVSSFAQLPIFFSMEELEQYKIDVRQYWRNYHLKMAEEYA